MIVRTALSAVLAAGIAVHVGGVRAEPSYPAVELIGDPVEDVAEDAVVKVSGRVVAGVGQVSGSDDEMLFSAWLPDDPSVRDLCLHVLSQDGIYRASANYTVSNEPEAGPRLLPFPARHMGLIAERDALEVGLLVETSRCDETVEGPFLVAAWRTEIRSEPDEIAVMVNSQGATRVTISIRAGDQRQRGRCDWIESGRRQGYDVICVVEPVPGATRQDVEISSRTAGLRNPPTRIEILTPW